MFFDPETDVKKMFRWNILYYNYFWSPRENIGKRTKDEFWRKLQDGLVLDYLKKMLCPVTTMVSTSKVVKATIFSQECYYSLVS